MILQKEDTGRQKREQEYRRELKNEVRQKQVLNNKSKARYSAEPQESFSLINHFESQQVKRKNKEKSYYAELEKQRKQQMQLKMQKKQEQKQRQIEIDLKIAHENEMLQKRFAEEKQKQQTKREVANDRTKQLEQYYAKLEQDRTNKMSRVKHQNKNTSQQGQKIPNDSLDKIQNQPRTFDLQSFPKYQEMPMTLAYPTRFENQAFNFPEKRHNYNNYYRELQLEKKKFQQESNSLRELNKFLGEQKSQFASRGKQGLESLKQLQRILDDQSISFTNNFKKSYNKTNNRYKTTQNGSYYFPA